MLIYLSYTDYRGVLRGISGQIPLSKIEEKKTREKIPNIPHLIINAYIPLLYRGVFRGISGQIPLPKIEEKKTREKKVQKKETRREKNPECPPPDF